MGCGPSVDIHQAAKDGNIKAVKQHLAAGTDVNAQASISVTDSCCIMRLGKVTTEIVLQLLIAIKVRM